MAEAVMQGVTLSTKVRRRPNDVFELALTYDGIEIRRPGESPRHLSWDRVSEWEIEQRRGGVLLTLRGGGSVTPLVIPRWSVDALDLVLRQVTSSLPPSDDDGPTGRRRGSGSSATGTAAHTAPSVQSRPPTPAPPARSSAAPVAPARLLAAPTTTAHLLRRPPATPSHRALLAAAVTQLRGSGLQAPGAASEKQAVTTARAETAIPWYGRLSLRSRTSTVSDGRAGAPSKPPPTRPTPSSCSPAAPRHQRMRSIPPWPSSFLNRR